MAPHRSRTAIQLSLVLALVVSTAPLTGAQNAARDSTTPVTGTLYDPAGRPADNTLLSVIAIDAGREFTQQIRTDEQGRFRFESVPVGRVVFRTPATDVIDPSIAEVVSSDAPVDVHMGIDGVAATLRACRVCGRPPSVTKAERAATTTTLPAAFLAAEPEEGWDAFNERLVPYPAAMRTGRLQGQVVLEGRVAVDGATVDLHVLSSSNDRLTDVARDIAGQVRWRPARIREAAVSVPLRLSIEFTLDSSREAAF